MGGVLTERLYFAFLGEASRLTLLGEASRLTLLGEASRLISKDEYVGGRRRLVPHISHEGTPKLSKLQHSHVQPSDLLVWLIAMLVYRLKRVELYITRFFQICGRDPRAYTLPKQKMEVCALYMHINIPCRCR
jgi:hypothetical protein